MALVSIIVPVFNAEKYLERCIKSIIKQTYKQIEIILVNDGSTDRSKEICKYYEEALDSISFFTQKNSGPSVARNLGLEKAKGEFVSFIDADDYIEENMIEEMVKSILENKCDLVLCDHNIIKDNFIIKKSSLFSEQGKKDVIELRKRLLTTDELNSPCDKLYKMSIINENSIRFPVDIKYGEDTIFNLMYVDMAMKAYYINKQYYNYVSHQSSSSRKISHDHLDMYFKQYNIKQLYLEKWNMVNPLLLKGIILLMLSNISAFIFLSVKSKRILENKEFFKAIYTNTQWYDAVQNVRFYDLKLIPRSYRIIAFFVIKKNLLGAIISAKLLFYLTVLIRSK
ncbi:glycosyltransferase [Neobacillus vireti]|uniref:glycosyltransferase n=1 Tax=Neobacillus vireti TaxID=220686 RepID=UPI0030001558